MASKLFSFFKQGNNTYEVKDAQARADITRLNNDLNNLIKTDTLTDTTTVNGNITTDIATSSRKIIGAYCSNEQYSVIPYVSNNKWSFHVAINSNFSSANNVSATIVYYYI